MSYHNLKGLDEGFGKTCKYLQANDLGYAHCERYGESLGNMKNPMDLLALESCCLNYETYNNCLRDMQVKVKEKNEAEEKAKQEEFNRGVRKLIEADSKKIQKNPDNDELYVSRAESYATLKELDKAIADFNEAIRLNPKNANAYANRGGLYNVIGKQEQGINDLNEAIQIDPNCQRAYSLRGCYYNDKKEFDKSIADLEKALELKPDDKISSSVLRWAMDGNNKIKEVKAKKKKNILRAAIYTVLGGLIGAGASYLTKMFVHEGWFLFGFVIFGIIIGIKVGSKIGKLVNGESGIGGCLGSIPGIFIGLFICWSLGDMPISVSAIAGAAIGVVFAVVKAKNDDPWK